MDSRITKELLTQKQVAKWLGVRPETIGRWTSRGILPCIRGSRKWLRYERGAVLALINPRGGKGGSAK
jgi:predicted site-specific integrase-resolvase